MKIIVAGIGTDVGKTLVSAILVEALGADYWKPVQCGPLSDRATVKELISSRESIIHPETYRLDYPGSPHLAALQENVSIDLAEIQPPPTKRALIIEMVGGVLVPLTPTVTALDLFSRWDALWVLVSNHYLGSINHTLLTIEALQKRCCKLLGIIFNGEEQTVNEAAILQISGVPFLGRLLPEKEITPAIIQHYGKQWKTASGIPTHKC